jgi:hypothetical protein
MNLFEINTKSELVQIVQISNMHSDIYIVVIASIFCSAIFFAVCLTHTHDEAFSKIKEWLDKCSTIKRRLDFNPKYYIRYNLKYATSKGLNL